jgi:hypothetical protein
MFERPDVFNAVLRSFLLDVGSPDQLES